MKPIPAEQTMATDGDTSVPTRWALASLALAMLMSSLSISSANVALPTIAQAFAASFGTVQWVVLAYLLAVTVFSVGAGRLADIVGPRRVLLAGILVFTAASAACAAAPTLAVLVVARGLQGLGGAVLLALTVAMVRATVPRQRTGSAMGLLGTMSAVGTALGPSLGGALIAGAGWRSIFLVMVPMGCLAAVLCLRHLPRDRQAGRPDRKAFDATGTLVLTLTLVAYALSTTTGIDIGGGTTVLVAASIAGAILFLRIEARAASPLIDPKTFADPALRSGLAANLLVSAVMMATFLVGPFYLSRSLGLGEATVGLVMSVGPTVSALTGIPAGRIVDRFGAPRVVVFGLVEMATGALLLALLPGIAGVAGYVTALAVLTPGYQLFLAANNTAVMTGGAEDRRGVVSGMLSLSRNLGFITGASVLGAVFAFGAAAPVASASGEAVAAGLRLTFLVAAGLMAIALVLMLRSRGVDRRATSAPEDA
ncbi:MFS family permease [Rhodobium orientis]|nr:MFS family permease [Rhodobium orientis]